MNTETLIADLARQIALRPSLLPLCGEQLDLLRSTSEDDREDRIGMLEDLRDRIGLEIDPSDIYERDDCDDDERSNGPR